MIGAMPPGALDIIEDTLTLSPHFDLYYHNPDVSIFILSNSIEGQ